eukprot:TRINITY_DN9163_c1_g3_i2.p1 TRINITY_DN9163_c1_g3~~TRINITY_DN9163_c1_g3_i2.p1  ORF type:complete len:712 (+),score=306.06 TRINITY_DN9163_c1_g3_i2:288-2423(+)
MSKFNGLFDDDSDDGAPLPAVKVPRPPVGNDLEQKVEEGQEQEGQQPPAVPTIPVPQPQVYQQPAVPNSVRSVASSVPPSATTAPAPGGFNPAASMPLFPSQSSPTLSQDVTFAASMPSLPTIDPSVLEAFTREAGADLKVINEKVQKAQEESSAALQTTSSEIQAKLAELMTQLMVITDQTTPPPVEVIDVPDVSTYPSFKVTDRMQDIKEDFEERHKKWAEEKKAVIDDADRLDSDERERDINLIQKHNNEQIQQLRREKDELRKQLEAVQTQLAGAESDLQQAVARDAQEIADFKKSFNAMMQQQAEEIDELKKSLKDQTERTEQLQVLLSTKKQQADERQTKIQEMDLQLQGLRVEKADFETRFIMTSKSLDTARIQVDEMREELKRMCDEKATLSQALDDTQEAKHNYVKELRKRHDEHLDMLAAKYQERENYYVTEYVSKEKAMRADMLKYAGTLRKHSEEVLGKMRSDYAKEVKEQNENFYAQAKEMKAKHKTAMVDAELAKEKIRNEGKKKVQELEDRMEQREEQLRKQHAGELEEARKRFDRAAEAADKRLSETVKDLRNEMSAKLTAAKQQEIKLVQQTQLEAKTKLAELESQHRIKETHMEKRMSDDKEQLMAMFSRELTKIGEEHRKAERDLERMHRDREAELEKRLKLVGHTADSTAASVAAAVESAKMKEDLVGKWDKHRQALRDRHETAMKKIEGS